jgi:hypothetical protein
VGLCHLRRDSAEIHSDDPEALALDARQHLPHEAAGDAVRLDEDKGAL